MSNLFTTIKSTKPKSNSFNLSHEKKMSMKMADLVPIMVQEIVPGDKFKVNTEQLIRLAPMIKPVMHRINSYVHYFFVPNRLLFNQWEDFITGGEDGLQEPTFPTADITEPIKALFQKGKLADYMGIPIPTVGVITQDLTISVLPFRAYQMIYNEYYRDENLQDKVAFTTTSVTGAAELERIVTMRKRCWEKDYFTSAQTQPQKGGEVNIPANVNYRSTGHWESLTQPASNAAVMIDPATELLYGDTAGGGNIHNIDEDNPFEITINDLRRSNKLQEWLEKNMRGGTRYIESILSHFGVKSSDSRLQRPQYLGGGKTPITISEVLNTTGAEQNGTPEFLPQGNQSGYGIGVGNSKGFKRSFEEHGFVIGIMSVLPRTAYQQGLPRHFNKYNKFDYFWPEFAHLGEQEILNQELYADFQGTDNDKVFGYQSRYSEYKFNQDSVHGDFKDNLSMWHMGRIFEDLPALNDCFVKCSPDTRIFAVSEEATPYDDKTDHLYVQLYNNIRAIRPMPIFGTPRL